MSLSLALVDVRTQLTREPRSGRATAAEPSAPTLHGQISRSVIFLSSRQTNAKIILLQRPAESSKARPETIELPHGLYGSGFGPVSLVATRSSGRRRVYEQMPPAQLDFSFFSYVSMDSLDGLPFSRIRQATGWSLGNDSRERTFGRFWNNFHICFFII